VLAAHAKLDLAGVAAATMLGPALNVSDGRLSLQLSADGLGASPAALIGSLHGSGTATIKDAQFAGLDAAIFADARQAAGRTGPIDMKKLQAAVNTALASGHLAVPQGDAALTLTSGAIGLDHVTLQAGGGVQLALDGGIDLGSAAVDMRLSLSEAPPASALIAMRPELSVTIKGPLASPQRSLDTSELKSWLSLSAAELQTRRIESIEAGQHESARMPDAHPAAPDAHSLSPGTAIESAVPPNLAAPAGAGGIERLQPPPVSPAQVPDQNHSGGGSVGRTAGALPVPMAVRPDPRDRTSAAAAGAAQ
jgi:hypothetical protein